MTQQLKPETSLANRYLIHSILGVGGMGAVYRARDLHFPNVVKWVAVKEMFNQANDPMIRNTIVRNFEREANLLATLDHSAIPRIYDYFTFNNRSYLILEFINGKDLEAKLNEGPISEELLVKWAIELCDVLNFLHNHKPEPIIFRDMKPSNVMINQHEHITLIDFGIAKPFQTGQKGTMIGTEGYSPPEQYRGEATPQTDIYALGATLHHLITRRDPRLEPPFSFGERQIRVLNPEVSQEFEAIILRALQYNPEDRFPSAAAMKDALLATLPNNRPQQEAAAPPEIALPSDEFAKPSWTFECEDEIRGSPSFHKGFVYIGSYDHNLYALNAATGEFIWKYPTDGGIVSKPYIHEENIYFGSEDNRLHVISQRSGRINWTYFSEGPIRSSPFIAEGHVFIGSDDGFLHAINTYNGRLAWKFETSSPVRCTPLVEHDMVYSGSENGDFFCLDFRGAVKWAFKAKRSITSSPIEFQGNIYFGSLDATLYALDGKTGWTIWRFKLGKGTISTPCLAGELIVIGCVDGNIYCIDTKTSKEIWRFETDHQVTGSPILYHDAIYCGSVDGFLYSLDCQSGQLRWKMRTNAPITGTPVAGNDMIYIGSTDHTLYAIPA
ncbi:MAG: serine/threonine-protein kinase [Anaerolineales bacterium]|nr:serine/threonine-protein kinase [Anaerolineales bacterium]